MRLETDLAMGSFHKALPKDVLPSSFSTSVMVGRLGEHALNWLSRLAALVCYTYDPHQPMPINFSLRIELASTDRWCMKANLIRL